MIWYASFALALAIILQLSVRKFAPQQITARAAISRRPEHASRSEEKSQPCWTALNFKDKNGRRISMGGRVVVNVDGESCLPYGLADGARVIADKLNKKTRSTLQAGDLIVIDSRLEGGRKPFRFRMIERVDGDTLHFAPTSGRSVNPKARSDAFARVVFR